MPSGSSVGIIAGKPRPCWAKIMRVCRGRPATRVSSVVPAISGQRANECSRARACCTRDAVS
jgi:hypothetical protein